ncbi:ABC transporter ATP-binding protein [Vibrio fluminensis]|uniref:ABC transporter ATP-binding protein n=1 Tax=Vibrio fluminensis TaxID=2783614 RepID=UPI0018885129|nr:ABC transporter ATP-binding protein [Vibrio fluminensis]
MVTQTLGVEINHAYLQYQTNTIATLANVNMSVPAGCWTVLLGRSGSGKTTLLRYLAGLLGDSVTIKGEIRSSDGQPFAQRIAYMAQQDLLLPWLNVLDNVCLSAKFGSTAQPKMQAQALLDQVGLGQYANAMPDQLSGGMRQRVALARTLMQDKPLVLMDEPFSALDAVTRHKLQGLAANLLANKTVILITHDPQEAVRLAEQLYVLQGTPAHAIKLNVPNTLPPRNLDAECAALQQAILQQLEHDYD